MRYEKIGSQLFKGNRSLFVEKMREKSIAVFNSNDLMPKNADQNMPFKQNSDLFYLTGIDQEESILMMVKRPSEVLIYLFIKETNENIKIWEGEKLSKNMASEISGIDNIEWLSKFEKKLAQHTQECTSFYLNSNEHPRANIVVESRDERFKKWLKNKYPNHIVKKAADILYPIRAIKKPQEISMVKKACEITKKGVIRVLGFLKPGVLEYEIEAEILHEFVRSGARGFAYDPIIASGANACVLHYNTNNQVCQNGDIILMDFGAEYANYASDLTRCFPVNGRFTKRQKKVYNSVLRVLNGSKKLLRPGLLLSDYEKNVGHLVEKELVDLKLLSIKDLGVGSAHPAYKKYFMHGTSHHLGLDVHDVSAPNQVLEKGMILTCEPGIYIPEEGLGIRLENDILIGPDYNVDLMGDIIIEAEEIEDAMNI